MKIIITGILSLMLNIPGHAQYDSDKFQLSFNDSQIIDVQKMPVDIDILLIPLSRSIVCLLVLIWVVLPL